MNKYVLVDSLIKEKEVKPKEIHIFLNWIFHKENYNQELENINFMKKSHQAYVELLITDFFHFILMYESYLIFFFQQ
jgi:hypothetical protein